MAALHLVEQSVALTSLLHLLLLAVTSTVEAGFMGCDYEPFFESSMTSLALKKFFNNTRGRERWPKQFAKGWETDEPCAWDGNQRAHPSPYGTSCLNGGWHPFPPRGDGGLLFLEHYSGEAEGEIPEEFKAFQMTASIGLSYNKLYGKLWDTSYHCFMQKLDLAHNRFSGTLPDDFMKINIHLENLNLAFNKFSGQLPKTLRSLETLVVLLLDHNEFTGEIPDLSDLKKLRHISLGHNMLSGGLGDWLQKMSNLGWLQVEFNNLKGPLPQLPGNITRVDFSGNKFTGTVPRSYGELGYLRHFNCTGCELTCPEDNLLAHLKFSSHCNIRTKS